MATEFDPNEVEQEFTYTGWGYTRNGWKSKASILQELDGIPQTNICEDAYICTYEWGRGVCYGDSGGPLWTKIDSNPVLYCIISGFYSPWGTGCTSQYFQESTRVSFYREWIESLTNINADMGYYIVQGKEISKCGDPTDSSCTARVVKKNEEWNVRCCADTNPGDWLQNKGCSVYTNSVVPLCYTTD